MIGADVAHADGLGDATVPATFSNRHGQALSLMATHGRTPDRNCVVDVDLRSTRIPRRRLNRVWPNR